MAITKIQSNAFPPTIDLSNVDLTLGAGEVLTANIADGNVTTAKIADGHVTHAKLHTDMDLSGKTVTLPDLDQNLVITGNLRIGNTGNVGAGTSAGNISFYAGGTYPGGIVKSYGGQAGGDLEFRTQTTAATGEGPVRLKIEGTGNIVSNQRFFFNGASNGIFWSTDGSSEDLWHIQSNVSGDLDFVESGVASNRLYLKAGGNVGIGTASPAVGLHYYNTTQARFAMENASRRIDLMADGDGFTIRDQSAAVNRLQIDTSGKLTVGSSLVRTEVIDLMALWRTSEHYGTISHNSDGGGIAYTFIDQIVKVTNNVGGHSFVVGKVNIPAGTYRIELTYRATNQQHSWNIYGSKGNEFTASLVSNAAYGSRTTYLQITGTLESSTDYSQVFISSTADLSAGTYMIQMGCNPYTGGGYQHYVESIKLMQVK